MSKEEWHEVDWVGDINTFPMNDKDVVEIDDYDERNRKKVSE